MQICMKLISDTIFGNGESIPGAEDIFVLTDEYGFPYFKAATLKGIFREELIRYMQLSGVSEPEIKNKVSELLGYSGDDENAANKMTFTDLTISDGVKAAICEKLGLNKRMLVTDLFTNIRTFTKIDENGMVAKGSLRTARCVNKGLVFYGSIRCTDSEKELIKNVLGMIKSIGTMRNRGFGEAVIVEEEK